MNCSAKYLCFEHCQLAGQICRTYREFIYIWVLIRVLHLLLNKCISIFVKFMLQVKLRILAAYERFSNHVISATLLKYGEGYIAC